MRRILSLTIGLLLVGCATAPRSPRQLQLDACLAQADRDIITQAQLEPDNRFSYRYRTGVGSGPEVEKFVACMQKRPTAYPTVR